jgi:DNA-binding CsgD family transcriptional regulator
LGLSDGSFVPSKQALPFSRAKSAGAILIARRDRSARSLTAAMQYRVSTSITRSLVIAMERLGARPEEHLADAGLALATLTGERAIPWEAHVALLESFGARHGREKSELLGVEYAYAFPALRAILGTILPIDVLVYLVCGPPVARLWPMYETTLTRGPQCFRWESRLRAGVLPSLPMFHATTGMLRALPRMLGLRDCVVETPVLTPTHALWDIALPPQRFLFSRFRGEHAMDVLRQAERDLEAVFRDVRGQRSGVSVPVPEAGPCVVCRPREGEEAGRVCERCVPNVPTLEATYRFTLTEARIARQLALGSDVAQTAKDLGLKAAVVRRHHARVVEKLAASAVPEAPWIVPALREVP